MPLRTCEYESRGDAEWLDSNESSAAARTGPAVDAATGSRTALEAIIGRAFHMRVLKELAHIAQNYPELPLILTERRIAIPCVTPDGFAISIRTERGRYVVHLGEWRDEFALANEVIELIDGALRGDVRIRIDIDASGQYHTAEQRLPNGEWISLPQHGDTIHVVRRGGPTRTIFLRNGPFLSS